METHISDIIEQIIANFNFAYMITVNILTYIIINSIDYFNGCKPVSLINKRICLLCSIIVCASIYFFTNSINIPILFNSSIAAPVFWSWIIKPIISKTSLDYRSIDDCLNK